MNFFEQQDQTRKNTKKLIFLFGLAVIVIAVSTALVIQVLYGGNWFSRDHEPYVFQFHARLFWFSILATVFLILLVSMIKGASLSKGGKSVAEMMGGRLLNFSTEDFHEKRLLNIVQEMALASGMVVPDVYLLDEGGINAFAAGFHMDDAVIGITRGCMQKLTRDELQGVIAHEFSHIRHQDMNINIKLISILHGILFLHFIGRILMRSGGGSRRSKNAGGVIIAGLALTLLGYFGYLFGRMIQSAVSRQREYLADASAVQYTRNPQGIAGALKKIGGFQQIKHARSILGHQKAQQVEHMMFSVATTPLLPYFLPHFFATHPPITKRIQAIDPTFSPPSEAVDLSTTMDTLTNSTVMGLAGSQASEASHPTPPLLAQERQFLNDLDPILRKACHHPQKAKALLYLLTTEFSESSIAKTHQILTQKDPYLKSSFDELKALIQEEHIKHRIELFDLCMPSLRRLSVKEYKVFLQTLLDIVHADQKVLFSEWIFVQLIRQHLHQYFFNTTYAVKYKKEIEIIEDLKILFSAVAYAGHSSFTDAQIAFDKGFSLFDLPQTTIFEQGRLDLDRISTSFTKLQHASSHIKTKALKAMEQIVLSDDEVTWEEYELFRALSDGLGNPTHPKMM